MAIDRVVWPVSEAATAPVDAPRRLVHPAAGPRPAALPVREPLMPSNFADRVAAAEQQAYARGLAEGERTAAAAAAALVEPVIARFAASLEDIHVARTGALRRAERDLVRLALAMTEHIIRTTIDREPHHLVAAARAAIERLGGMTAVTVRLNPADLEAIRGAHPEALTGTSIEVIADPQVPRGGCLVRSTSGVIDAGIEAQMRELARGLLGDEPASTPEDDVPRSGL